MKETYGHAGKILRVDLSRKKIDIEPIEKYSTTFLGGRGINQWILYNEVGPDVGPLNPEGKIIFGAGVLVGVPLLSACRLSVDGKNIFSNGVGSANSGGHFAPEMKCAGYDHVIIQGKSQNHCYLWINDDDVEIRDGKDLWGKTTWETDDLIREELGDSSIQVASIGQAGENLVRAACIISNGGRSASRCGLGALMGSKNLKSIAIRGTRTVNIAYPDKFFELATELRENMVTLKGLDLFRKVGTIYIPEFANNISDNPVRNFQYGFWNSEKIQKTSSKEIIEKYVIRTLSCFGCSIPCSHFLRVPEGELEGTKGEGFECNTLRDFGCRLDNDYLPAIVKAQVLCSQYGLDVDNTSGVIAWAMECYQRGILTESDTDGLNLEWGDYKVMLELVKKIALREGIGNLLAEGSQKASRVVGKGSENYSMNIMGQELYETLRASKGWALGTILSPIGGGHMRGAIVYEQQRMSPEDGEKFFRLKSAGDGKSYEGKAKLVTFFQNYKAVVDSLGICVFATQYLSPRLISVEDFSRLYWAVTGKSIDSSKMLEIGERIHNLENAYNIRAGITRKDYSPPKRFFEPEPSGPGKGEFLDKQKLDGMIDECYEIRGWNKQTGAPSRTSLEKIGLKVVADDLEKRGKLAV